MIPGVVASQEGANGVTWRTTTISSPTINQWVQLMYYPTNNTYIGWDPNISFQDVIAFQSFIDNPTSVSGSGISPGWGSVAGVWDNSNMTYSQGWWFFPDADSGSRAIKHASTLAGSFSTLTFATNPRGVIYQSGSNRFIAFGASGGWSTAPYNATTLTWTARTAVGNTHLRAATNGTRVVFVGSAKTLYYVDGGTALLSAGVNGITSNLQGIEYGNGFWVTVGNSGELCYSTTGVGQWTVKDIGAGTANLLDVKFYKGHWYATTATQIFRSLTDSPASDWTQVHTGTNIFRLEYNDFAIYGQADQNIYWAK